MNYGKPGALAIGAAVVLALLAVLLLADGLIGRLF